LSSKYLRPGLAAATALTLAAVASPARADDAGSVARAREQVESGAYADALRTLSALRSNLAPGLAVEAALLEANAALVVRGDDAGQTACAKAVVAAGYDPDVARDQPPKVRVVCRAAAAKERRARLDREKIVISDLEIEPIDVAFQPVRLSAKGSRAPAWLRVVARVTSPAIEGSFDLVLAPSIEGPLRGTLDPSWIRPSSRLTIDLVAQDRFGDLGPIGKSASATVPTAEAMVALGPIPSGAEIRIDGTKTAATPAGDVVVTPGKHKIKLELESGASASTTIEIERGSVARVALAPQRAGGVGVQWFLGAGALAVAGVGSVFLVNAASRKSEIESLSQQREPGTSLPATEYSVLAQKDQERKTFGSVGLVLGITAGALAITAVTVALWPSREGKKKPIATLTPQLGIGRLGLAGSF
jgi:hypothetical protein